MCESRTNVATPRRTASKTAYFVSPVWMTPISCASKASCYLYFYGPRGANFQVVSFHAFPGHVSRQSILPPVCVSRLLPPAHEPRGATFQVVSFHGLPRPCLASVRSSICLCLPPAHEPRGTTFQVVSFHGLPRPCLTSVRSSTCPSLVLAHGVRLLKAPKRPSMCFQNGLRPRSRPLC